MEFIQNAEPSPELPDAEDRAVPQGSHGRPPPASTAHSSDGNDNAPQGPGQVGGVHELLQALREALQADTQATAFKQFSQVQQHMAQAQQARPVEMPPRTLPAHYDSRTQRSRLCTLNDRGCLWKSPKVDQVSWQREIARLETAESGFLCCCLVFVFILFVSKQITFPTPTPLDEFGVKKKRSR